MLRKPNSDSVMIGAISMKTRKRIGFIVNAFAVTFVIVEMPFMSYFAEFVSLMINVPIG